MFAQEMIYHQETIRLARYIARVVVYSSVSTIDVGMLACDRVAVSPLYAMLVARRTEECSDGDW
jgi:hypothetical protein